jgi:polysaccharide pyruvyl transferase WcaK-like protein
MIGRVVLTGYYGFGNLGDDLLCLCTVNITRRLFPDAEITIFSWSKDPMYLRRLLDERIQIATEAIPPADLIIHGGGGVFFDFKHGRFSRRIVNSLIRAIGIYRYHTMVGLYRRYIRNRGVNPLRIGLGLGIGTYTPSSERFFSDAAVLADFSYLMVRDEESASNLAFLGIKNTNVGTDLVFGYDFSAVRTVAGHASGVAFILRDWTYDNNAYLDHWFAIAQQLVSKGFPVAVISFDQDADKNYLNRFSAFEQLIWNPRQHVDLSSFLSSLGRASVIISSRAHGIIAGAGLGVPSLCIEIEPKLRTIARMLPNATTLIKPDSNSADVVAKVIELHDRANRSGIESDVNQNREALRSALSQVNSFLTSLNLKDESKRI